MFHLKDTATTVPSKESQGSLHAYMIAIQDYKNRDADLRSRLRAMDTALRASIDEVTECDETLRLLNVPVSFAQLDTELAQLVSIYLSGYPMFPVVGTPDVKELASKVEGITDQHSRLGHWGREYILFFRSLIKYNVGALELDWRGTNTYQLVFDQLQRNADYQPSIEYINAIKCPDMYNTLWDSRVDPALVSRQGEWAGYNELLPLQELIRRMYIAQQENRLFNHAEALSQKSNWDNQYWWQHPVVSKYKTTDRTKGWQAWLPSAHTPTGGSGQPLYFVTTLYCRITPSEYQLGGSEPSQIWKLRWVNNKTLWTAEPITTFNNLLPMYFGQYTDDNMGDRTPSQVEYSNPFQEAASELLNNRVADAQRSVADRLLYDTSMVRGKHIASRSPTARIPVDMSNKAQGAKLSDAVSQLPYGDRNAATVIGDMRTLVEMPQLITGNNSADEGRFRKGNRTLGEFNEIQQNSDARTELSPISLEEQVFQDLKQQLKFNLVTRLDATTEFLNPELGEVITLSPEEIRENIMRFKFADGVKPKSMIGNTQTWAVIFDTLTATGMIQQYDALSMFEYISSLGGVHDLKRFRLGVEQALSAAPAATPANGQTTTPGPGDNAVPTGAETPTDQVSPRLTAVPGGSV